MRSSRPIQARPVGPVGRFVRWSKREPAKAALLGVLARGVPRDRDARDVAREGPPAGRGGAPREDRAAEGRAPVRGQLRALGRRPEEGDRALHAGLEMEGASSGGRRRTRARAPQAQERPSRARDSSIGTGRCSATARPPCAPGGRSLGSRQEGEAQALMKGAPAPQERARALSPCRERGPGRQSRKPGGLRPRAPSRDGGHPPIPFPAAHALHPSGLRGRKREEDRDAAVETASVLRRLWPGSASALRWGGTRVDRARGPGPAR